MSNPTEQSFLKDVAEHQMLVLRDDGVFRHIRFKKPGTGCMHFDLVTWPGYLAYSGDMGCFIFSRLNDMFEFFRTDREYPQRQGKALGINQGYWAEKLQAADRQCGYEEFDANRFKAVVKEYRHNWMRSARESGSLNKEQRRELWDAVEFEVLDRADDGEFAAFNAVHDFLHRGGAKSFRFDDFFEHRFTEYTYRFVWCCYALAWGILQYDNTKAEVAA